MRSEEEHQKATKLKKLLHSSSWKLCRLENAVVYCSGKRHTHQFKEGKKESDLGDENLASGEMWPEIRQTPTITTVIGGADSVKYSSGKETFASEKIRGEREREFLVFSYGFSALSFFGYGGLFGVGLQIYYLILINTEATTKQSWRERVAKNWRLVSELK